MSQSTRDRWIRFWMRRSGLTRWGRVAARLAAAAMPPYKGRLRFVECCPAGYVAPSAVIHHDALQLGPHVFVGDRVLVFQDAGGGPVRFARGVHLYGDTSIEVGQGGNVTIGAETHVQPGCQFTAYGAGITIGDRVEIAPHCAFYPYDHAMAPERSIREQGLVTKGDIVVGDDAWLGFGVIVLSGVRIGHGAVIGAGAVVTRDVPPFAIAVGAPARVARMRLAGGATAARGDSVPAVR